MVDSRHFKSSYNTENIEYFVDYNTVDNIYFRMEDIDVINKIIKKINLCVKDINIAKMHFGFDGVNYT